MKFYAFYSGVAEFVLISEKEHSWQKTLSPNERHTHFEDLSEFPSLKHAKSYLLMHINGDISDLRRAKQDVKDYKTKRDE